MEQSYDCARAGNNKKETSNYEIQIFLNFKSAGFRPVSLNLPEFMKCAFK